MRPKLIEYLIALITVITFTVILYSPKLIFFGHCILSRHVGFAPNIIAITHVKHYKGNSPISVV